MSSKQTPLHAIQQRASINGLFNTLVDKSYEALITHNTEWQHYLDDFHFRNPKQVYHYTPLCYHFHQVAKPDGGIRVLSILEDKDNFLAHQILEYLYPWVLPTFHRYSYGGIPRKPHFQAVLQLRKYAQMGYPYLTKIDILQCYPSVDRVMLEQRLQMLDLMTPQLARMLLRWVSVPIYTASTDSFKFLKNGLPAGCPLSNLFLNIFLTPLDEYCESLELKFVRVYDDIFVASKTQIDAHRAFRQIKKFIEIELKMKLHPQKSKVTTVFKKRLLGFTLWERETKIAIVPNIQNVKRFKSENLSSLIETLKKNKNICSYRYNLNQMLSGWASSYQIITDTKRLKDLDSWIMKTTLLLIPSIYKTRRDRLKAFKAILTSKKLAHQLASKQPAGIQQLLQNHVTQHKTLKFGTKLISTYDAVTKRKFQKEPLR